MRPQSNNTPHGSESGQSTGSGPPNANGSTQPSSGGGIANLPAASTAAAAANGQNPASRANSRPSSVADLDLGGDEGIQSQAGRKSTRTDKVTESACLVHAECQPMNMNAAAPLQKALAVHHLPGHRMDTCVSAAFRSMWGWVVLIQTRLDGKSRVSF